MSTGGKIFYYRLQENFSLVCKIITVSMKEYIMYIFE